MYSGKVSLEAPDEVVLRTDSSDVSVLAGRIVLELTERTMVKDIQLVFSGRSRIPSISEGATSSLQIAKQGFVEAPIYSHDFSFLPSFQALGQSQSSSSGKHHTHTLRPGTYTFPFSLDVPSDLPATLRTYFSGFPLSPAEIGYRLKATVSRPGMTTHSWKAKKDIRLTHGLPPDSPEFSASLDVENTWPSKLSYAFTIPHKAYPVGGCIPIGVKFVPHGKNIHVTSLQTVLRQTISVTSKMGVVYSDAHDVMVDRKVFVSDPGAAAFPSDTPGSGSPSRPSSRRASHERIPHLLRPLTRQEPSATDLSSRLASLSAAEAVPSGDSEPDGDGLVTAPEVETVHTVRIPTAICPSSSLPPLQVSYRLKWNAYIRNADNHVSELRCALPVHILAASLAEEARLASSGARNLLFGPNGALVPSQEEVQQADLPSYQNHVHDRLANADSSSTSTTAFRPTPWAGSSTRTSPSVTPLPTPSPSRPSSPVGGSSRSETHSGASTPAGDRPPFTWADSELLASLAVASSHESSCSTSPLASPAASSVHLASAAGPEEGPRQEPSPAPVRRSSQGDRPHFFGLHLPKPLRPFTPLANRQSSSSGGPYLQSSSPATPASPRSPSPADEDGGPAPQQSTSTLRYPTPLRQTSDPASWSGARIAPLRQVTTTTTIEPQFAPLEGANDGGEDQGIGILSQVPSYAVASRWLGGTPVPIDFHLPSYDESVDEAYADRIA